MIELKLKELKLINVFNSTCIQKMEKINLKICLIFEILGDHLTGVWGLSNNESL